MTIEITISPEMGRWERGFARMPIEAAAAALPGWQAAADVMFDKSQQFVHVISGDLKSACDGPTMSVDRGSLVAEILYDTDYAIYEHARGGDHAWLDRAYEATSRQFEQALGEAFERLVRLWN